MATSVDFALFVCDNLIEYGDVRYRKMFGEYMVYINDKPILLLCDNTVFAKKLPCIAPLLENAPCGIPYRNAKEYYILDIENHELCKKVVPLLEQHTPFPIPKKRHK